MPDLLLELFSEEIPARMQRRAAEDLRKLITDALVERGFVYEGAKAFATPRRLALNIVGLPAKGQDVREERRGPRVGSPPKAVEGFLKSAGLQSLDEAKIEKDPKKGEFYVAIIDKPGRATAEVLAEILPSVIRAFPWPKSMRWGAASAKAGSLAWVRPLHSVVATFGPETEEPDVVGFAVDGIASGDTTFGHRFMAPQAIKVRRFDDYAASLAGAKVVLDADRRKDIILTEAKNLAFARGLDLVEDEALLEEVAGLVEWPVVLVGEFEAEFLAIPPEVIRATIRANQKCFVLRKPDGSLANQFILVSNIEARDGGKAIAAGNARVVRARLSDARHFWNTDLASLPDHRDSDLKPLDQRLDKLVDAGIVFHEKLGTQGERIERIAALARELAPLVGADPAKAERAARLAKADLVSEMVGEFPELQGLMGRYYAERQGEDASVARAIEEHYKPQGPNDRVPTDPVAVAVALADKLDTLVGFWAIDEKPTGSKDPYALRRAALGVIRLVLENACRISLASLLTQWFERQVHEWDNQYNSVLAISAEFRLPEERQDIFGRNFKRAREVTQVSSLKSLDEVDHPIERLDFVAADLKGNADGYRNVETSDDEEVPVISLKNPKICLPELLAFFADRLKVYLRDKGARHDLIDAVFALDGQDDLLMIVRRVEALGRFLDSDDGKNLLVGTKRAANILRIEEKKDSRAFDGAAKPDLFKQEEERGLAAALDQARSAAAAAIAKEDFEGAMAALAKLRVPVDAFFDKVTVNTDDPRLRENRLKLLSAIRDATRQVADFSKIEG